MTRVWAVLAVLLTTSAWASESWCQGDARNLQRDLILNGNQLPPSDRLLMERRLNNAEGMCSMDSNRARSDLENLRRDMILQAERPPVPPVGGGSWAEPRRGTWE
ncbi:MAG: hypothetical protein H7Y60_15600 [Rhodospirillaceae bacterium]|nr:hypothetical protein [Rhodospirillales bacterium]